LNYFELHFAKIRTKICHQYWHFIFGPPNRIPLTRLGFSIIIANTGTMRKGFPVALPSPPYPGFIDHVVNKKAEVVRVYLPPDANCLLSVMDHCLGRSP
jgi:hypothetical protein